MAPKKRTKPTNSSQPSDSVQFFLNSIRDANNPQHCGRCLLGSLLEPSSQEKEAAKTGTILKKSSVKINKNAKFWDAILIFLFTERTDEQVEMLLTRLSKCSCQLRHPRIRDFHVEGYVHEPDGMNRTRMEEWTPQGQTNPYTAERCALIVELFVILNINIRGSKARSVASGSASTWPSQPKDVLPFGADNLVRGLLQWYRFIPDPIMLMVAGAILPLCGSLLAPSLIQYNFTSYVVDATHRLAIKTLAGFRAKDPITEKQTIEMCHMQHTSLSSYYHAVCKDQPTDIKAALVRGNETKLVQACSLLAYVTVKPRMPEMANYPTIWADTVFFAHDIFRLFQMQKYPAIPLHPAIVALDLAIIPQRHTPRPLREGTILDIRTLRARTHCFNLGCTNSHASAGKEFQRCSGCKVASYCGRECQMKAWRAEKFPHRRGCVIIKDLVELGGGLELFNNIRFLARFHSERHVEESTATILRNWSQANVKDSDLQYIKDWCKGLETIYSLPDGKDKSPGYADYEIVLKQIIDALDGPKPYFFDS